MHQMDVMIRCMKVKRRYITLVKRSRYHREASTAASTSSTPPFTALDESELRRIEESIPVQALLVFRQFAAYEMVSEAKREEKELQRETKGKNIMASFGWTSNSSAAPSGVTVGKEKAPGKPSSSSSISSWFKNLKKSKKSAKREVYLSDTQDDGQKNWKKGEKERVVEDDERDEEEDDDERLIEIIQSQLDLDPLAADHTDQFIFRLVLTSSASLRLTTEAQPVAVLEVALSSTTEMKADGIVIKFALDDFQLIDECTVNPLSKYLIVSVSPIVSPPVSVSRVPVPVAAKGPVNPFEVVLHPTPVRQTPRKAALDSAPKLLLVIDITGTKTVVRLTARPMEATWNELCVGRLLGIFIAPDVTYTPTVVGAPAPTSSTFSPLLTASLNKFKMDAALPIAGEMELIVEIDAPKIIIPDDCYRDSGCLLADMGYLVVRGE